MVTCCEVITLSCSLVILVPTDEDVSEAGLADTGGAEDDDAGTRVPGGRGHVLHVIQGQHSSLRDNMLTYVLIVSIRA